jgi:MATE family, multidrug efflux pump
MLRICARLGFLFYVTPKHRKRILGLALPIVGGMVSQNILNLVDTAMVAHLGTKALAAVGIGSLVQFMSVAFFTGLASSVQAIASRRVGEEKMEFAALPLNGAIVLTLALGLPLTVLLFLGAGWLLSQVNQDTEVLVQAIPYYQARVVSVVAVGMNFAFRGFWNATNRPKLYMRTLIFMHSINIVLNYLLIYGKFGCPELGALGAGVGSCISAFLGTAYYFSLGWTYSREHGFLGGFPGVDVYRILVKLLLPTGVQQFLFATGMTVFFALVGKVGTEEVAVTHVLVNLLLTVLLVQIGFGMAAGSLAGQALGAGDPEEAKSWGWRVVRLGFWIAVALSAVLFLAPQWILAPFIKDSSALSLGEWPLRIIALTLPFDAMGMIMMQSLLGVGDAKNVMGISLITQWILFLPVVYFVGPVWQLGLAAIWSVHAIYRLLQAASFAYCWQRGKWAGIKV